MDSSFSMDKARIHYQTRVLVFCTMDLIPLNSGSNFIFFFAGNEACLAADAFIDIDDYSELAHRLGLLRDLNGCFKVGCIAREFVPFTRDQNLGVLVSSPAVLHTAGSRRNDDGDTSTSSGLTVLVLDQYFVTFVDAAGFRIFRVDVNGGHRLDFKQIRRIAAGLGVRDVRRTSTVDQFDRIFCCRLIRLDINRNRAEVVHLSDVGRQLDFAGRSIEARLTVVTEQTFFIFERLLFCTLDLSHVWQILLSVCVCRPPFFQDGVAGFDRIAVEEVFRIIDQAAELKCDPPVFLGFAHGLNRVLTETLLPACVPNGA